MLPLGTIGILSHLRNDKASHFGELLYQDFAEVKLDELKKMEDFHIYKEFEDVAGGNNGVQITAKDFQEPKEVPSDSATFDEGVLLIATMSVKPCG